MTYEAKRKDFEAWAMSQGHIARELAREGDEYKNPSVHWQWQAWQAATRAAVPDGWRAVPVEPSPQMTVAAMDAYEKITRSTPTAHPNDLYRAMIAAAPEVQP